MDPSILQLFAADEVLDRLARNKMTGCFKVFTPLESADVFFKKGLVVGAVKGLAQGEEALRQIVQWKDALFLWQPNVSNTATTLTPVTIKVEEFLAGNFAGRTPLPTSTSPGEDGKSNGTLRPGDGAVSRTATRSFTATGETRANQDEDLLRKHKLVLVSLEEPPRKFKIAQISSLIGRNPTCDIAIPDASISRQHCLLQMTDRGLHVKDLNTVNGTKINGIVLKEGYINVGDKLSVGHFGFKVEKA